MKLKYRQIVLHIVGSVLFLILPMFIYPRPPEIGLFNLTKPALEHLLSNLILLAFFYSNYYTFIPNLLLRKRYVFYSLVVLGCLLVLMVLPAFVTDFIHIQPGMRPAMRPPVMPKQGSNFMIVASHEFLLFFLVVLFSILLRVRERLYHIESAKNRIELLSLKDQINPHFLFNTLNSVYAMALNENANQTASSLLKLSGMMRYVVDESKTQFVSLEKEIQYINDYVELQRTRLDESIEFLYTINGEIDGRLNIAPLILIPFIENAFKHGVNPDEKSSIVITITVDGPLLTLNVSNRKVSVTLAHHEISGKGLSATESRLRLLYPNRYDLTLKEDESHYNITLQLHLNAKSDSD